MNATVSVLVLLSLLRLGVVGYGVLRSDIGTDRWVAREICAKAQSGDIVLLADLSWCPMVYYLEKVCPDKGLIMFPFLNDVPIHPLRNLAHSLGGRSCQARLTGFCVVLMRRVLPAREE